MLIGRPWSFISIHPCRPVVIMVRSWVADRFAVNSTSAKGGTGAHRGSPVASLQHDAKRWHSQLDDRPGCGETYAATNAGSTCDIQSVIPVPRSGSSPIDANLVILVRSKGMPHLWRGNRQWISASPLSRYMALTQAAMDPDRNAAGVALSGRFPYIRPGDFVEVAISGLGRPRHQFITSP